MPLSAPTLSEKVHYLLYSRARVCGLLTTGLAEEGANLHADTDTDCTTLSIMLTFLYTIG